MDNNNKRYRQRCGRPGGIYEWDANPGHKYPHNGWLEDKDGRKIPACFSSELNHVYDSETSKDLIEITPYKVIEIDAPGYGIDSKGFRFKAHFAGVSPEGKLLVWTNGMTSWTNSLRMECTDFIPKGADE